MSNIKRKEYVENKITELESGFTTVENKITTLQEDVANGFSQDMVDAGIQKKIDDGTIANLTIEDASITLDKLNTPLINSIKNYGYNLLTGAKEVTFDNMNTRRYTESFSRNGLTKVILGLKLTTTNFKGRFGISNYALSSHVYATTYNGVTFNDEYVFYNLDISSLGSNIALTIQPYSTLDQTVIVKDVILIDNSNNIDLSLLKKSLSKYGYGENFTILNLYTDIKSDDIPEGSITDEKLNISFRKPVKNLAYETMNIEANSSVTVNNVNGTLIVKNTTLDSIEDKYYLAIKHSNTENCYFAVKAISSGNGVKNDYSFSSAYSNEEVTIIELDLSNFDNNNLHLAFAKLSAECNLIVHSLALVKAKDIDKDSLRVIMSNQNTIPKYLYTYDIGVKDEVPILCIGDSMINSGGTMAPLLKKATGHKRVYDYGHGGDTVGTTLGKFGVYPLYVEPFTIPSDTTEVDITLKSTYNKIFPNAKINPLNGLLNECYIGGVKGNITNPSGDRATYKFKRSKAGEEKVLDRNTKVITSIMTKWKEPVFPIIWIGTNAGYDTSNPQDLVDAIKTFVKMYNYNGKALIIGFYKQGNTSVETMEQYEELMFKEFGNMFINMREYMTTYALEDAGITPTDEDITAMGLGKVPPSAIPDGTHYGSAIKTNVIEIIVEHLKELNIV